MDFPASPQATDDRAIISRLAALDLLIKETRRDLDETLELIERLREQCVHLKGKLRAAELEQASLLTEAERL